MGKSRNKGIFLKVSVELGDQDPGVDVLVRCARQFVDVVFHQTSENLSEAKLLLRQDRLPFNFFNGSARSNPAGNKEFAVESRIKSGRAGPEFAELAEAVLSVESFLTPELSVKENHGPRSKEEHLAKVEDATVFVGFLGVE